MSKHLKADTEPKTVDDLLDRFFIMRAGTPDDDLEELKLRNEMGEPKNELAHSIKQLLVKARLDVLEKLWQDYDTGLLIPLEERLKFRIDELRRVVGSQPTHTTAQLQDKEELEP